MFQRIFKNPISSIAIFTIALVSFLVHFIDTETHLTGWAFLLYLLLFLSGMEITRKTLLLYFPDLTVAFTLLVLAFGTNLLSMVSLDYRLQQVLLFSLYAMVVFLTASWHEHQKESSIIILAIVLGLIILFQPTGYLSLLIPVLWGVHDKASWKAKIASVRNQHEQFWYFLACLVIVVFIPLLLWEIGPGEIKLFSFQLPGVFYSFSSFLWNDFFSFDHGWFIYTPLMVFAFIGFYFFAEKNRPIFYPVFIFCILDIFLETSWSELGTTPVFGQVAFVATYALLVLPVAYFIGFILTGRIFLKVFLSVVIVFLIFMNIFQTWQFNNGIILHSGMTGSSYCRVFGRTGVTEIEKMQMAGIEPDASLMFRDETRFRKIILASYDFEDANVSYRDKLEGDQVKNGKMAFTMDSISRFTPAWEIGYDDFTKKSGVGMRITASVFAASPSLLHGVNLVISSTHEGNNYRYKLLNLGDLKLKPGVWNTVSLDYLIPKVPEPEDKLVSYIWYMGKAAIYIDDLKYEAFEGEK